MIRKCTVWSSPVADEAGSAPDVAGAVVIVVVAAAVEDDDANTDDDADDTDAWCAAA